MCNECNIEKKADNQPLHQGLIVRAVGGLFFVQSGEKLYRCTARGLFRKDGLSPLVGDQAFFTVLGDEGLVTGWKERKNALVRPPVANVDRLFVVVSMAKPSPNLCNIDKLLAIAGYHHIEPIVILTKTDLADGSAFQQLYRDAGYEVYPICAASGEGIELLLQKMPGGINVFIGNSGVGKSTALNALAPHLQLNTAQISEKLGRGKHTTRHSELYPLPGHGYLADTPGFSTIELLQYGMTEKTELAGCFKEFIPSIGRCRFPNCTHTVEKGCDVLRRIEDGEIAPSRHKNYTLFYHELARYRSWDA